jgi:hypothetical protein
MGFGSLFLSLSKLVILSGSALEIDTQGCNWF